jgi:hypothetical protein
MDILVLDIVAKNPVVFARSEAGLPRMHVGWIGDTIQLANWDHVRADYILTSASMFTQSRRQSDVVGPVTGLQGTHLHPLLRQEETATA